MGYRRGVILIDPAGFRYPSWRIKDVGSPYKTVQVNNFNMLHFMGFGST